MSDDVYLNALHDLERGVMLCFVEGCDGGAVDCHIRLRQSGFRDYRVRDDADVSDEPAELDVGAAGAAEDIEELRRTEGWLFYDSVAWLDKRLYLLPQLVPLCPLYAVRDRKMSALACFKVVLAVSVERKNDVRAVLARLLYLPGDYRGELLSARKAERAVDEIVLVIDHDKQFFHVIHPFRR